MNELDIESGSFLTEFSLNKRYYDVKLFVVEKVK